jgi:hypothetical protein
MINAAIADGDWVVTRQQEDAENGEIVAAMINGEATVKTLEQSDGHVWLMPHNPAYTPTLGDDATVLGQGGCDSPEDLTAVGAAQNIQVCTDEPAGPRDRLCCADRWGCASVSRTALTERQLMQVYGFWT